VKPYQALVKPAPSFGEAAPGFGNATPKPGIRQTKGWCRRTKAWWNVTKVWYSFTRDLETASILCQWIRILVVEATSPGRNSTASRCLWVGADICHSQTGSTRKGRPYASTSIGGQMRKAPSLVIAFGILLFSAHESPACTCVAITPTQGFDQAQAVFTGKVIKAQKSRWTIIVDRVWKGRVEETITLRDGHPGSSCAAAYKRGESYLFLINVEEGEQRLVYSPQICNWGTLLKSTKVAFAGTPASWIEDLVLKDRGAGMLPLKKVSKQKMSN
jgi:hypothetical protein